MHLCDEIRIDEILENRKILHFKKADFVCDKFVSKYETRELLDSYTIVFRFNRKYSDKIYNKLFLSTNWGNYNYDYRLISFSVTVKYINPKFLKQLISAIHDESMFHNKYVNI